MRLGGYVYILWYHRAMVKTRTAPQVAVELGFHTNTVRRWLEAGDLRGTKTPGGHWRVKLRDIEEFKRLYGLDDDEAAETTA